MPKSFDEIDQRMLKDILQVSQQDIYLSLEFFKGCIKLSIANSSFLRMFAQA